MDPHFIGLDIGGTQLRAALADRSGQIQRRIAVSTEAAAGKAAVLRRIRELIRRICQDLEPSSISAVGIGVPGPTDPYAGVVMVAPNLPGWHEVNLHTELDGLLPAPLFVGNDANLAGLAEHRFGAGRGCAHMIYITVSTGVGGGIIVDNQMLLGRRGLAAEIGHMTIVARQVDGGDPLLGTLEDLAAGPGIARRVQAALRAGAQSEVLAQTGGDIDAVTPQILNQAATAGDPFALAQFRQTGHYLGVGITNLLHIFNPQRIVIGGSVWLHACSLVSTAMWETIRSRVQSPAYWQELEIVSAALGDDAGLLGAVALAITESNRSS